MPSSPKLLFNRLRGPEGDIEYDLKEELRKLMSFLIEDFDVLRDYEPAMILSSDEAHCLTTIKDDKVDGPWSPFSELMRSI
jgi:hypothetical protein